MKALGALVFITFLLAITTEKSETTPTPVNPNKSEMLNLESVDEISACCKTESPLVGESSAKVVHEPGRMMDEETFARWKDQARTRSDVPRGEIIKSAEEVPFLPSAPVISRKFDGTDQVQAGGAFPPDTNIAVSETHVLEAVNFLYRLSTKTNTNVLTARIEPFHKRAGKFLFDPRVFYDSFSKRFVVVALEFDNAPQTSFIHLAVSKSGSPTDFTTSWCFYRIPSKIQGTWADYPNVGMNEKWMAITTNNFKFAGNQFNKARIKVIDLSKLANNANSCPRLKTFNFSDPSGAIYPVQYHTATGLADHPLQMIGSLNVPISSLYFLYKVAGAVNPSISKSTLFTTATYGIPPDAKQKGGGKLLSTGDSRIIDAEFRNGSLFFAHSTSCNFGGSPNVSCVRVGKISGGTPTLVFQLTVGGGSNNYFWFPGIGVSSSEDIALAFQESGNTRSLGLAHSGKKANAVAFDPYKVIKQGTCKLENLDTIDRNRTGDYTGIHVDPSDGKSFWYSAEYAKKFGNTCGWGTFIVQTR
jgi:hypothetical protein